jgi:hypothetical protein
VAVIFEKPNYKKKSFLLDFAGYTVLVVVLSSYATYGGMSVSGLFSSPSESKVTFLDVINGIAQIATAAAFFLAVLQYRKAIRQQRQLAIAEEAKRQLAAMTEVAKSIRTGEDTSLESLDDSLRVMVSLAVNFDQLFGAMDEDLHRAMVRMQWQNMYYGHLLVALGRLDLLPLLRSSSRLSGQAFLKALQSAKEHVAHRRVLPVFEKYELFRVLLSDEGIASKFTMRGKLSSLDQFVFYFLNKHKVDDLLYGLLNQIDIRAQAPLLAVGEPSDWVFKKLE